MKKIISLVIIAIIGITVIINSGRIFETNRDGEYQVKQAFYTGDMSVRSEAGTYGQLLGTIWTYRNVGTVAFGRDEDGDGTAEIAAIPVIFNDGSKANISGLIRVKLPTSREKRLMLKTEYATGYQHFIESGIIPIVRNAVKLSANLRSAQEAYTTLALFQQAVEDQLENGTYLTVSKKKEFTNSTGDKEIRQVTIVREDADGNPMRVPNRLQELGCEVVGCVVDVPKFDKKVEESIALRKDEAMKTELAKQEALRAKQDAIKAEEQGKANAAKSKWAQETINAKEVALAEKNLKVAELAAKTEAQNKKKKILAAEAVKAELQIADGLSARAKYQIDADVKAKIGVAEHMSKWVGPKFVMGSGGNGSGGSGIENALMIKMMTELVENKTK